MKLRILAILLACCSVSAAHAQFIVQKASPSFGSKAVPLSDTVAFAFSNEVSVETNWNTAFLYEPRDAVEISRTALCLNFEGACAGGNERPRYVRFTVNQQADTDYTWLVYGVESAGGAPLAMPYVLRYSTAATIGTFKLAGTLGDVPATNPAKTGVVPTAVRHIASTLAERGYIQRHLSPSPSTLQQEQAFSEATGPHTLVLLLDEFSFNEAAWTIQAATIVAGESGPFEIAHVRAGTYWPIAVRYADATRQTIEALGFYDPDQDDMPDEVNISDQDASGLMLTMHAFPRSSSAAYLSVAQDSASHYASDQRLIMITAGHGAQLDGDAYEWNYWFHSRATNTVTTVVVNPLQAQVFNEPAIFTFSSMATLDPAGIVDSRIALEAVAQNGGTAFWEGTPIDRLNVQIEGGNLHWLARAPESEPVWRVAVRKTGPNAEFFERFVFMVDGTVVSGEAITDLPTTHTLAQNYPNPFNPRTTIGFTLAAPGTVTLVVYDVLGREVARLADGPHPAGAHQATWDGRDAAGELVAGGVYLYRLRAGGTTQTRRMVLLK